MTWTPADLFSAGQAGGFYLPGAAGGIWSDDAMATPAAVGGTVGGLTDFSGNGNHALQAEAARRPQVVSDTGRVGLLFDTTNDVLRFPSAVIGTGATDPRFDVSVCYLPNNPARWMLMNGYLTPNPWWLAAEDSSSSGIIGTSTGTGRGDIYFNNSPITSASRRDLLNASKAATRLHLEGIFDYPRTSDWGLFKYSSGSYTAPGIVLGILIREGRMTAAERAQLDAYWQSLVSPSTTTTLERSAIIAATSGTSASRSIARPRSATVAATSTATAARSITRQRMASIAAVSGVAATRRITRNRSAVIAAVSALLAEIGTAVTVQRSATIAAVSGTEATARRILQRAASVAGESGAEAARTITLQRGAVIAALSASTVHPALTINRGASIHAVSTATAVPIFGPLIHRYAYPGEMRGGVLIHQPRGGRLIRG